MGSAWGPTGGHWGPAAGSSKWLSRWKECCLALQQCNVAAMLPQCVVACIGGWVLYQSDWLDCRRSARLQSLSPRCPQAPSSAQQCGQVPGCTPVKKQQHQETKNISNDSIKRIQEAINNDDKLITKSISVLIDCITASSLFTSWRSNERRVRCPLLHRFVALTLFGGSPYSTIITSTFLHNPYPILIMLHTCLR